MTVQQVIKTSAVGKDMRAAPGTIYIIILLKNLCFPPSQQLFLPHIPDFRFRNLSANIILNKRLCNEALGNQVFTWMAVGAALKKEG